MQQFARLVRLQSIPKAILSSSRPISKNVIDELLKELPKEQREQLKEKVMSMENDSRGQAMAGQMQEIGYQADRLIQQGPRRQDPALPSIEMLKRKGSNAVRNLRLEVYSHATSLGLEDNEARNVADRAVYRATQLFDQKANQTVTKFEQEAKERKDEEKTLDNKEKQVVDFASKCLEKLFAPRGRQRDQHKGEIDFAPILADPKAKNFFGNTDNALNYFDAKASKSAPTSYWASMEKRKTYITNLSAGPTNAFEEQILWTEQGKMWPYPIDNEYLIGKEENISFTEHIFLDQYLAKKHTHLPKTGPIAHFMELVCVGLSKNPYMELSKKHMHLDSFAEFFNPEQIARVEKMHEIEKQAALG